MVYSYYSTQLHDIMHELDILPHLASTEEQQRVKDNLNMRISTLFSQTQKETALPEELRSHIKSLKSTLVNKTPQQLIESREKIIADLRGVDSKLRTLFPSGPAPAASSSSSSSSSAPPTMPGAGGPSPASTSSSSTASSGASSASPASSSTSSASASARPEGFPVELDALIGEYTGIPVLREIFPEVEVTSSDPSVQMEAFRTYVREKPVLAGMRFEKYIAEKIKTIVAEHGHKEQHLTKEQIESIEGLVRIGMDAGVPVNPELLLRLVRVPISLEFLRELLDHSPLNNQQILNVLLDFCEIRMTQISIPAPWGGSLGLMCEPTSSEFIEIFNLLFARAQGVDMTDITKHDEQSKMFRVRRALTRQSITDPTLIPSLIRLNEYPTVPRLTIYIVAQDLGLPERSGYSRKEIMELLRNSTLSDKENRIAILEALIKP